MEKQALSIAQERALKKLTRQYQSIFELDERKKTLDILVEKNLAIKGEGLYCADYRLNLKKHDLIVLCADCGENEALVGESLCCFCIKRNLIHHD